MTLAACPPAPPYRVAGVRAGLLLVLALALAGGACARPPASPGCPDPPRALRRAPTGWIEQLTADRVVLLRPRGERVLLHRCWLSGPLREGIYLRRGRLAVDGTLAGQLAAVRRVQELRRAGRARRVVPGEGAPSATDDFGMFFGPPSGKK
ncbi:MAG: hypothetical protein RBU45_12930 [Myxococcota bacterium]|nr:hypothetical protein [Myxococcota bacterium]